MLETNLKHFYSFIRSGFSDWNQNYEKLTDMIVPRSSQLVTQDNDYGLFTVTLFKKVAEEFKHHARERKYDIFKLIDSLLLYIYLC